MSVDGIEMNFALNYLAYFLLATRLVGPLGRSGAGRIVNVAAEIHRGAVVDFADLFMERDYDPILAFRRSKFCVVAFTHEYSDVAPSAAGARLPLHLATSTEIAGVSGAYFVGSEPVRADDATYDLEITARLWERSEALVAG